MRSSDWLVFRTTSEKLESTLNQASSEPAHVHTVQWLGGRDWIVLAQPLPVTTATSEPVDAFNLSSEHDVVRQRAYNGVIIGAYEDDNPFGAWVEDVEGSWILYLDKDHRPEVMWLARDRFGGVLGAPVRFTATTSGER